MRSSTQHNKQMVHGRSLKTILLLLAAAAAVGDRAAAAAAAVAAVDGTDSGEDDKVTVQFYDAYQYRNNQNSALQSHRFAFGNNPGTGIAPPSMRQQTAALSEEQAKHYLKNMMVSNATLNT